MHGTKNIKFTNAQQTKQIYQYKNIKEKLYKTNAAIWYNKTFRQKQFTSNYNTSFNLLDCLYKCMKNEPYKTECTDGLLDAEHMMFKTCRRQEKLN